MYKEPWETPVWNAQVKTANIANRLAGDFRSVAEWEAHTRPPFCLRILKEYRTPEMQAFRDKVAQTARAERKAQ